MTKQDETLIYNNIPYIILNKDKNYEIYEILYNLKKQKVIYYESLLVLVRKIFYPKSYLFGELKNDLIYIGLGTWIEVSNDLLIILGDVISTVNFPMISVIHPNVFHYSTERKEFIISSIEPTLIKEI